MQRSIVLAAAFVATLAACESRPKENPFANPAAPKQPPPLQEAPKPSGPPAFAVNEDGPKIGWTSILLDKPDGTQKLHEELGANKEFVSGHTVKVTMAREAKLSWVVRFVRALEEAGASGVEAATSTRPEYAKSVILSPLVTVKDAARCSVVAKVLSERRNAVWHLEGGTAIRSPKGLAGPDMAMTVARLEQAAARCKGSDVVFVSADEDVEWGLVYDLAAATKTIEGKPFERVVLLSKSPVAGRPVEPG